MGYPSLPDQSVNFLLDELLGMKQIGITLTEHGAMHPHSSVCGMMLAHPASRYFSVGKIGEDQLDDYARRRGNANRGYAEVFSHYNMNNVLMCYMLMCQLAALYVYCATMPQVIGTLAYSTLAYRHINTLK